jgi:tRNA threonylcarbamoyl adenosine modification protein (Sua5/YciO/YrdC/YwlC family)
MIVEIDPLHPEPRKIARAVAALEAGEVIAYPTDTVYALGCDLHNRKAIDRIYQVKRMKSDQPLAFVCHDLSEIARWAIVENAQYRLLRRHLPGPYTFILDATREVPKVLLLKRKQVGIRVPANPVSLALTEAFGRPIISTTAGWHGQDAFVDPHEIAAEFPGVAMVLDAGVGGILPTTVVDLTGGAVTLVREGAGDPDLFQGGAL